MEPLSFTPDVAIIGAGPVGLALSIELSRRGLDTLVLDKRPPPDEDVALRPQLLVARLGDLANLAHLGVDIDDERIVSLLATRCGEDLSSRRTAHALVNVPDGLPPRTLDLRELTAQPPVALAPIGRLQRVLLARALASEVIVRYRCDVVRLRRHARAVSLVCGDGTSVRAMIAIIATGAGRALVAPLLGHAETAPPQRLIAGVFAAQGEYGRWVRAALPVPGFRRPVRCTLLQPEPDADAGTALLVDTQVDSSDAQLCYAYDVVARVHGLGTAPDLVAPQVFTTGASAMRRRFVAGDNRAPVVVAGDAAQTGHVFSGQTCFVNLALALTLAHELASARSAIADRLVNAPALHHALVRYERASAQGATLLAKASAPHAKPDTGWALRGLAVN